MKQELLEQFEGYDKVRREIEISRKFGDDFSLEKGQVAEYVNRLHPSQIKLRVSKIIEETVSTKTLRLTAVSGYLPPLSGRTIHFTIRGSGQGSNEACLQYLFSSQSDRLLRYYGSPGGKWPGFKLFVG